MARLNGVGEEVDFCSACKIGCLRPTGEVVVKGESAGGFTDIGHQKSIQM